MRAHKGVLVFFFIGLLQMGGAVAQQHVASPSDALSFDLKPESAFALGDGYVERGFKRGQRVTCQLEAQTEVETYPSFRSDVPVYGSIRVGGTYAEKTSGFEYAFALDESKGTGTGYDRLYIDLDRDGNLANNSSVSADAIPPANAELDYSWIKEQACFKPVGLPLPCGAGAEERPIEVMPRLMIAEEKRFYMSFVPTQVRKGNIEIAGHRFKVLLGHASWISGWLDQPHATLQLIPEGKRSGPGWWGSDQLRALHQIGDTYYCFKASPAGDRLMAQAYQGAWGILQAGAGGRDVQDLGLSGSVRSRQVAAPVGKMGERNWPEKAKSCRLPVGDYAPSLMTVTLGRLNIEISENYHSDGKPLDRGDRSLVYSFRVRQERPFSIDFSNKPEVLFASPARDERFKPGDEILVKAVLIDPQWDIMIRGLDDTGRKQDKEFKTSDGRAHSYQQNLSLDPKVIITRADGRKVAEGILPFG